MSLKDYIPQEEDDQSIAYTDVAKELLRLGITNLPNPEDEDWCSIDSKFRTLKIINLLLTQYNKIEVEGSRRREKRIDPISARTRGEQQHLSQLRSEDERLNREISKAEENLLLAKEKRTKQAREFKEELREIEEKIKQYNPK
ncbi:hypothetical protein GPJ56_002828 [Histomonas meleagridis]|uniref:uncharacterized protein n=1 Tax=Histomonas meleagridis TaxID=135588 RepID=UPI00355A1502|nr:hypothetical protein GPJ56_002828 [Histomonas meleagridis]KAH0806344.1 hypothetical protein GO595_001032 [Histomonas meleagridis]